jgi:serine/threonine protein kinase
MEIKQKSFSTTPPSIPGFSILEEIGRGGMGIVYKALQLPINRLVALKIVVDRAEVAPDDLIRFLLEGELLARLQHPHIVQIYAVGKHPVPTGDVRPYMAMEYLNGGTLKDQMRGRPFPAEAAARMLTTLARAVHYAHERGVVHRDLKPANVLMSTDGTPKITDFGLAKQTRVATDLTEAGFVVGTPEYMAPEQARGKTVGPASDIHALGMILYEMLTGKGAFSGESDEEIMQLVARLNPMPPTRLVKEIPPDLEMICLRCLAKRPAERYPSAAALAEDLDRFLAGRDVAARRLTRMDRVGRWLKQNRLSAGLMAVTIVLAVATTILSFLYSRASGERRELTSAGPAIQPLDQVQSQVQQFVTANKDHAESLYGLAAVLAAASAAAQPSEVADGYAVLALDLLRHARRAGYFNQPDRIEALNQDAAFTSLKRREDYRRLIQELSP